MKLFYVVAFLPASLHSKVAFSHMHVHAGSAREAMEVVGQSPAKGGKVHVYDLSQDALCPGRLELEKVPREEFIGR